MEEKNKIIILSVIVSTFNRGPLMLKNVKRMLGCKSKQIEFIIGDNASTDNTLELLNEIEDSRVRVFKNEENYDLMNIYLLAFFHARGKYFICVNDRDYIKASDLDKICANLMTLRECDIISAEPNVRLKDGYYRGEDIPKIFIQSRHPGTWIYSTKYYKRSISRDTLSKIVKKEKKIKCRIQFELLCHADKAYVHKVPLVHQPKNREKILQRRVDPYGVYIDPSVRLQEYFDFLEESNNWSEYPIIRQILFAKYEDSFTTVTYEYYMSMRREGFAERYHYFNHSANEWLKNGIYFSKSIIFSGKIKDKKLLLSIIIISIKRCWEITRQILGEYFRQVC